MAVSSHGKLHTSKFVAESLGATAVQLSASSDVKLFAIEVDNQNNSASSYFKVWERTAGEGGPSVGTDAPTFILEAPAGRKPSFLLAGPDGYQCESLHFFWIACVTTAGTAGTTAPTNAVDVTFYTD